eukprot:Em0002g1409a
MGMYQEDHVLLLENKMSLPAGSLANDAALNTKCEMEVIWKIVKVGFDWKLVGNRLLTPQSVTDISRDESDEANRRDKMLITWLQQDGAKATYARLVEVLKDVGRTDTAEKVIELVTGKGVQPSPVLQLQKSGESQQPLGHSNWSQPSHVVMSNEMILEYLYTLLMLMKVIQKRGAWKLTIRTKRHSNSASEITIRALTAIVDSLHGHLSSLSDEVVKLIPEGFIPVSLRELTLSM